MKTRLLGFLLCMSFCSCSLSAAEEEIPFRVNRVTERVTLFAPGRYAPPASMAVISTDKGLVVIDTSLSPLLAELCLKEIKKELGRDDVLYVINTHHHFDHTGGNQVFKGVEIVGHENVGPAMSRPEEGAASRIQRIQARLGQRENRLRTLDPNSPEALSLAESIRLERLMIEDLPRRYVATPPTRTFSDRVILNAGGLELRLYYFGRAHTDNDIVIHVPELDVLFTGDLFSTDTFSATVLPGPIDVQRWLAVLDEVLKTGEGVKTVVGGHMVLPTREWLDAEHRYIKDLWAAVTKARSQGATLQATRESLPLEPSFAYLAPYFDLKTRQSLDRHRANIQSYWRAEMMSAASEIEQVIRQSGLDAARARFQELRAAGEREFFIDEQEFNALGYKFLQQERKTPEAVAVFTMNTEAFPESWNVWDSLGEAFLLQNDQDKAEACYVKSLELNPDSRSGKNNLSEIRGHKLDLRGETKEAAKFEPGRNTGLKGPYLGQTPPGLEPKVFAPGVVSTAGSFEFSIAFSPDGREVYFTRRKDPDGQNTMMASRREKEGWTAPEEAAFCKGFPSNEPHITPDGKKLYFGCNRRRPGAEQADYGIWVTDRANGGWSEPRYHGPGMFVSSTLKGDLYMTDVTRVAGGGLIKYPLVSGAYGAPERLPGAVNAPVEVAHAYIAPDESYIVFDSYLRPDGQGGEGDLYVVFRNPDGSWSEAVNLGDKVNTPATNFCPVVTPDGKYLFYSTSRDIYWVSAEVIHRLRTRSAPSPAVSEEILSSALSGDLTGLQALVEKDPALLKAWDSQGRALLHGAAASGQVEMVRWLIDRGAEVDARTARNATPLILAASAGKADTVRLLLEKGASLSARDSYQRTALILAARESGDAGTARILLDAGADINAQDRFNDTSLTLAAWRGFSDLVGLLLERGARLPASSRKKQQLFVQAVSTGLDNLFDRLLPGGLDLSVLDGLGGNLLHSAADGGSEQIMKALLERDLPVNLKDRNGWTPLHRAAERGRLPAAALLIERGAKLNERTLAGETPYNLAALEGNTEIVDLLKSKGADQSPVAFPELRGEYLGQTKPGGTPALFAPGIVSSRFGMHSAAVFSSDGR